MSGFGVATSPDKRRLEVLAAEYLFSRLDMERSALNRLASLRINNIVRKILLHKSVVVAAQACNTAVFLRR